MKLVLSANVRRGCFDDSQCPVGGGTAFNGYLFLRVLVLPEVLSGEAAMQVAYFNGYLMLLTLTQPTSVVLLLRALTA
ncbi:MAG: hypothetical protein R2865_10180 [Deinococcales bacterium]